MLPNQPIIGTLRVRTRRNYGAALRLDIERQLAASTLDARHIGPAAILLIRRLEDPLPRRLREPAWHRALRSRIDSLCAGAARPRRGRIDAHCHALLFSDEAEMLACLSLDMSVGGDPATWWRRAIARFLPPGSLRALLAEQPRLLSATFEHLARWHALKTVVSTLGDEEALALCTAFAAENELRPVLKVVDLCRSVLFATEASSTPDFSAEMPGSDTGSPALATPARPTPWETLTTPHARPRIDVWIPAGCETLGIAQRLLIAVVRGFKSSPAQLAAPSLAIELRRWLVAQSRRPPATPRPAHESAPRSPAPAASSAEPAAPPQGVLASPGPSTDTGGSTDPGADHGDEQNPVRLDDVEAHSRDVDLDAGLDGIDTRLGGLLFLINVMEHLGLPECFEEFCGLAGSVGTLGTLEAIARVMAGTHGEELAHDPVWAVLAKLDGREPPVPPRADGLQAPGDKLPTAWLAQLGDEAPAPRESDSRAIEALRHAGWPPALLDWLVLVMPFIGYRIASACALESVDEAVRLLIDLPARVYVTESHIDVVTSIENIRVPIRLAGLDRSPGWVRSMQRVVLFHFE